MADTSPTLERQRTISLDVYSVITESFSAIAKDFVEYVKLRTGRNVSTAIEIPKGSEISPTPEVEVTVEEKEKKKESLFSKIIKGVILAIGALYALPKLYKEFEPQLKGIGEALVETFKKMFSEELPKFFKEKWSDFSGFIKDIFSGEESTVGKTIENAGFFDKVKDFFLRIGDMIAIGLNNILSFITGQQLPAPKPNATLNIDKELQQNQAAAAATAGAVVQYKVGKAVINKLKKKAKVGLKNRQARKFAELDKKEALTKQKQMKALKGSNSKWTRFLNFAKRKSPKLMAKVGVRLATAAGLAAIPVVGWIAAIINIGLSVWSAYEIYQLWKEFNQPGGEGEKQDAIEEGATPTVTPETTITEPPSAETTPEAVPSMSFDDTKSMIIQHEGWENTPYKDTEGFWTVGVGHLIGNTLPSSMDRRFSDEEVASMFEKDFEHHKKIAEQTPGYSQANEAGKGAMIDLAFNMGKWWPKWPNTKAALEQGNFTLASENLKDSEWFSQVGVRGPKIVDLIAQAGDGQGSSISMASNDVAVSKRSMMKAENPTIINAPTTTNTNIVSKDVTIQKEKRNTGDLTARMA